MGTSFKNIGEYTNEVLMNIYIKIRDLSVFECIFQYELAETKVNWVKWSDSNYPENKHAA